MKFFAALLLFGVAVAGTLSFVFCPLPGAGSGRNNDSQNGGSPLLPASSAGVFAPETSGSQPVRISRRKKHGPENGIETERNFFGEIRDWARKSPEAALAWAQQQPAGGEARREALTDACFQIVQTDPMRAVVLAEHYSLDRDSVLQNLAQQWAAKDLASACRWIAEQPDDDQRNALTTGAMLVWSQTEPADAAQFVMDRMSPGSARDAAVMMVVHQWAGRDCVGAAAWVRSFPESPLRTQALEELAEVMQYRQAAAR